MIYLSNEYVNIKFSDVDKDIPTKETFLNALNELEEKIIMPKIIVNTEEGATITGTINGKIVIATYDSTTQKYILKIPDLGSVLVTATKDGQSNSKTVEITTIASYEIDIKFTKIYGVEWDPAEDFTNPLLRYNWTRTDNAVGFSNPVVAKGNDAVGSSPFDNISPWKDMIVTENNLIGTVVSIPKFYFLWSKNESGKLKLQISSEPVEGFHVSPLHMDRGDGEGERDVVYVARYKCTNNNDNINNNAFSYSTNQNHNKSITNSYISYPTNEQSIFGFQNAFREQIIRDLDPSTTNSLGETNLEKAKQVYLADITLQATLEMLFLVEFASWDIQGKIGIGGTYYSGSGNRPTPQRKTGYTDNMQYHTGSYMTTSELNAVSNLAICNQYRHIEGYWDISELGFGLSMGQLADYYNITNPPAKNALCVLCDQSKIDSKKFISPTNHNLEDVYTADEIFANLVEVVQKDIDYFDIVPYTYDICTVPGYEWILIPVIASELDITTSSQTKYTHDSVFMPFKTQLDWDTENFGDSSYMNYTHGVRYLAFNPITQNTQYNHNGLFNINLKSLTKFEANQYNVTGRLMYLPLNSTQQEAVNN